MLHFFAIEVCSTATTNALLGREDSAEQCASEEVIFAEESNDAARTI